MYKKKKYRFKPRFYVIIIVLILLIFLIINSIIPKNHEKKYKYNDYEINEVFNNNDKRYSINITKDDKKYDYNFDSKYIGKKIIKGIDTFNSDNTSCIVLYYNNTNSIPLCIKDNNNIDFRLVDNIDLSSFKNNRDINYKSYNNIDIYDTLDKKYLIYNYHGFNYIDNNKTEEVNLFKNDYYNISLATKFKDNLIIPDYDSEYNFKKLIIINCNNLKQDIWELNFEISFNSYILGTYDNSIFIVDRKNNIEYELDVKKRKMITVGSEFKDGVILNNNKLENISMYKLVNNTLKFDYGYDQNYIIENNNLYLKTSNTKILVSNNNIKKIVYSNNNYVYYLVGDTMYYYDVFIGEVKVMKYFEWNFNNENMIFIY